MNKTTLSLTAALFAVAAVVGCSAIAGIEDVPEPSGGGDSSVETSISDTGVRTDSGGDSHDGTVDSTGDGHPDTSDTSVAETSVDSAPDTSDTSDTSVDSGFEADTTPPCTTNQLVALEPSIANTGDTITLEGTFCGATTVTFPGGATASATLLGTHRATVVVPAAATAGDLAINVGGTTYGPLFFRRASFGLGLQQFQQFDDQTNGPRQMPSLVTPRIPGAAIVTKNFVHIVGGANASGALTTVESARINADGSLGAFTTDSGVALATPAGSTNSIVVIGDFVYLVGGDPGGTPDGSVERAPILADGSLGTFTLVAGVHLLHPRYNHAVVVVGNSLVVVGGTTTASPYFLDSVEAAPIQPDGSLGSFADVGHLVTARESHAAVVAGGFLYVLGGDATFGGVPAIAAIERAPIDGSGVLGGFTAAGSLAIPRQQFMVWRLGSSLFVGGGGSAPSAAGSVESASIAADGTLGSFTTVSASAFPFPVQGAGAAVVGNYAYSFGGSAGGSYAVTQRAQIDGDGKLDTTVVKTQPLVTARDDHSPAVLVGNTFYLIGGDSVAGFARSQQASVALDGTFGTITTSSATTATTGLSRHSAARIGGYVYLFGGATSTGGTNEIEQAPIKSDGTLDVFTKLTATLTGSRASHATAVVGSYVHHIGGFYGATATTVESATIHADGTLDAFAVGTATLTTAHTDCTAAVFGNYLYVFAGNNASESADQTAIERITLNPDGSLSGTFSVTNHFVNARQYPLLAVVGPYLYAIGGDSYPTDTTVERATINPDGTLGTFAVVSGLGAPGRWPGVLVGNALQTCMIPTSGCAQMSLP